MHASAGPDRYLVAQKIMFRIRPSMVPIAHWGNPHPNEELECIKMRGAHISLEPCSTKLPLVCMQRW